MPPHPLDALRASLRAALPRGWDVARDVLLVVGPHAPQIVATYRLVEQARILVAVPDGTPPPTGLPDDVVVADVGRLAPALASFPGPPAEHVQLVPVDGSAGDAAFVERLRREAERGLLVRAHNHAMLVEHGAAWLARTVANLPALAASPSVAALAGAFAGRPAVVVSPGPSLSKQLEHLACLDGRALVVAGTHAALALERAGAAIDLLVALDPAPVLAEHLTDVDVTRVGALVASSNVDSTLLALPFVRRFFYAANGPLDRWAFPEPGAALAGGGSVSCTAFSLAVHLGCDPIVLVGQDLSYADGRFYAAETLDGAAEVVEEDGAFRLSKTADAPGPGYSMPDGTRQLARARAITTLPGWHGGEVRTSEAFARFHAWFELEARVHAGRARLVNATEGGARIEGFEQRAFAELQAGWNASFDARAELGERARVDSEARRAALAEHVAAAARPTGALGVLAAEHGLLTQDELNGFAVGDPAPDSSPGPPSGPRR